MRPATVNAQQALRKFWLYTHETARFAQLQGDSQAKARADILSTLYGRSVSKAAATANKVRSGLLEECGINTAASCVAECEAEIRNYCRDEFGTQQGMGALKW